MAAVDEEMRNAVREYVMHGCNASNIGRFWSTDDPNQVNDFADWFSEFAMNAVRWYDETKRRDKSESLDG